MDGKLVRLRGYEMSDLDTVTKWLNDEEVTQFLGSGLLSYPVSSIAERKFIEQFGLSESSTEKTFAVETLADGRLIGTLGLHGIDWINRHSALGIIIGDRQYWGRGYGTDAMLVLMRLAFDKLNLHRLWLHVYDFKTRAIASYQKCGFRREGVLREQRLFGRKYHDTVVMGILEAEYHALGEAKA
ncbi:MAG TPA: GNAT family protein [Candidatus Binataceae bacterium]|nr:GNAT family protein [Candidatus Binataceae bacterium]